MGLLEPDGRSRRLLRRDELSLRPGAGDAPPVIVIHSLAHAVAALSAASPVGRAITLASAPGAGIYGGPGWWRELVAAARAAVPTAETRALLDCGGDSGAAQAAIRAGVEAIIFTGRRDVAERLANIASQQGSRLETVPASPLLDLGALFFAAPDALQRRVVEVLAGAPHRDLHPQA